MAEYLANQIQTVPLNGAVNFTASIPCNKGFVYHEDETGIFILRGIVNNPNCSFARYQVTFNGNVALPADATAVTPISLALSVNGEARTTSRAIYTPAAVDEYGNLTSTAIITVPRGCCFSVSVRYIDATETDSTTTPAPAINVQNANIVISRIS